MKKANFKESNRVNIARFFDGKKSNIEALKLMALHKIINLTGAPIEAPENKRLHGVKVIEYKAGHFGGLKVTNFGAGFFPAKIDIITLKS